jgi:hypothetical protein
LRTSRARFYSGGLSLTSHFEPRERIGDRSPAGVDARSDVSGVSLLQLDGDDVEVLLRRADLRVAEELLHLAHACAVLQ